MAKRITALDVMRALVRAGFVQHRHHRGSHRAFTHPTKHLRTVVAEHPGEFPPALLRRVLGQIEMTEEEFKKYL